MKHPSHIEIRGKVLWYRRKIPADLVPAYNGKREFRHSLNTSVEKDAIPLARQRSADLDKDFKLKRRELASRSPVPAPIPSSPQIPVTEIELDDEQIRRICLLWQRSVLVTDDQNRMGGFVQTDYDDLQENLAEAEPALRQALARGQLDVIGPALHSFLFLCKVRVDEASAAYRQLKHQFLQAILETVDLQKRRLNGDVVRTDIVAPASDVYQRDQATPGENVFGINALFELWKNDVSDRPPASVSAFKTASSQFGAFIGDVPMSKVSRKQVIAFRDKLKNEDKLNYRTIENKMALLSAMFGVAVGAEILGVNPAARIKVTKPKVPPIVRLPYSVNDLQTIFSASIYQGQIPKGGCGDAGVWLPALGLYTGARLEELAQLQVSDVINDPEHGWYLNVTDLVDENNMTEGDTKRVKTPQSRRRIPLHPALVDAGFLRLVERCKQEGHSKLFPLLKPDVKGKYSASWSKWWGRYARKNIGILSELKVFHSLRHNFKQATREFGIAEDVHDAITGHSGGGEGRNYGDTQYPLSQLVKAMRKVKYPGVVLPVIEHA